jgi:hypothetical protein
MLVILSHVRSKLSILLQDSRPGNTNSYRLFKNYSLKLVKWFSIRTKQLQLLCDTQIQMPGTPDVGLFNRSTSKSENLIVAILNQNFK